MERSGKSLGDADPEPIEGHITQPALIDVPDVGTLAIPVGGRRIEIAGAAPITVTSGEEAALYVPLPTSGHHFLRVSVATF